MKIEPHNLTVLIDKREQRPWSVDPLRKKEATLQTGDYSILGLESHIAIERKSLDDLMGCIGKGRERFERELDRLRAYPCRYVIVEANWGDIEAGSYRSKIHPNAAMGSICAWMARGIPFLFAGRSDRAGKLACRIMYRYAVDRAREATFLVESLKS
jgi:ERCC4-type nuclease